MKSTGIVRNIDELGRLVIPKELREKMDIPSGSAVEIYSEEDKIIIKKFYNGCILCGSTEQLVDAKGKNVCRECIKELASI
jgi:transcriptional pleiotropic regulator of transition state genes